MLETTVHKHVGEELVDVEVGSQKEVQSERVVEQIFAVGILPVQHRGHESRYVDDEQVFGDSGYIAHTFSFC